MSSYKAAPVLLIVIAASGLSFGAGPAPPSGPPEPAPPKITPLDQRFVTRFVRRTLRQYIEDESLHKPAYVPPALRDLECHAVVTLWQRGFHRATGISERRPVLDACQDAALIAITLVADMEKLRPDLLDRVTLEIEIAGNPVALPIPAETLLSEPITPLVEPGIHGVVFELGDQRKYLTPGEIIVNNAAPREALAALAKKLSPTPEGLTDVRVARFRTVHWVEREPGGDVVELWRGMTVVAPNTVSAKGLSAAANRVAAFLRFRQLPDGGFNCLFVPSLDAYSEQDSPVAQACATYALAAYGRRANSEAAMTAATKALDAWTSRIVDLPGVKGAGFVRSPDGRHKLGLTALICLALTEHPQADKDSALRNKLVAGMLWLQQPSGEFITAFPPTDVLAGQTVYPGEALLALARAYEDRPQQRIMVAFDRALDFYRSFFAERPSAAFAGWHIQAFAAMARQSKRNDFAQFAFRMADALVDVQLSSDNCPWPDKWGGFAPYEPGVTDATTSLHLEGLVDALGLARQMDDTKRAQRYEQAVRSAARFVIQLQFRPEEAYYVRGPRDVIGGIRANPNDNTLRIDHCGHALIALNKAQEALFPDGD